MIENKLTYLAKLALVSIGKLIASFHTAVFFAPPGYGSGR
jgi:hypothetical protein